MKKSLNVLKEKRFILISYTAGSMAHSIFVFTTNKNETLIAYKFEWENENVIKCFTKV